MKILNWLKSFFTWIAGLFVHETVEQVIEQVNKPDTQVNEDKTDSLKRALDADLRDRLRQDPGDSATQRGGEIR